MPGLEQTLTLANLKYAFRLSGYFFITSANIFSAPTKSAFSNFAFPSLIILSDSGADLHPREKNTVVSTKIEIKKRNFVLILLLPPASFSFYFYYAFLFNIPL